MDHDSMGIALGISTGKTYCCGTMTEGGSKASSIPEISAKGSHITIATGEDFIVCLGGLSARGRFSLCLGMLNSSKEADGLGGLGLGCEKAHPGCSIAPAPACAPSVPSIGSDFMEKLSSPLGFAPGGCCGFAIANTKAAGSGPKPKSIG